MKQLLLKYFPWLLSLKGWLMATSHALLPIRNSYSQGQEDDFVEKMLSQSDLNDALYVDVGANHPSRLSNTYKFYRRGCSGVVIEPNQTLLTMHRTFRKRDVHFGFGCGEAFGLLEFVEARSHVLSGFHHSDLKTTEIKTLSLLPVVPLDAVMAFFPKELFLLSIDVEGFDLHVARGAEKTLNRTKIVIIEGDAANRAAIENFFSERGFRLETETKHNLIFLNASLQETAKRPSEV